MQYTTLAFHHRFLCDVLNLLDKEVKKNIQNGWKPLGGVCVGINYDNDGYYAVQAMIKEE